MANYNIQMTMKNSSGSSDNVYPVTKSKNVEVAVTSGINTSASNAEAVFSTIGQKLTAHESSISTKASQTDLDLQRKVFKQQLTYASSHSKPVILHTKGMEKEIYDEELELIPNATMDGINECGVICSINVVPGQDAPELTGTNPEAEDLHVVFIPRFVLDNATSADQAIKLLKERNIITTPNVQNNIQVMISDIEKTYVIEFIGNEMLVKEKVGNKQIMTNYYCNLKDLTEHSHGVERAEILKENYKEGSTFCGMRKLLQRVKFSNVYRFDNKKEFYSEFATQSQIKNKGSDEWKTLIKIIDQVKKDYWIARAENKRYPADLKYWLTVHNSTYDIERKILRISVQENYRRYFDFKII